MRFQTVSTPFRNDTWAGQIEMSPASQSEGGLARSFHIAQRQTAFRAHGLNARSMRTLV